MYHSGEFIKALRRFTYSVSLTVSSIHLFNVTVIGDLDSGSGVGDVTSKLLILNMKCCIKLFFFFKGEASLAHILKTLFFPNDF